MGDARRIDLAHAVDLDDAARRPVPASGDDLEALNLTDDEHAVLAKVGAILRRLNFGTVVLVVQDGKVVHERAFIDHAEALKAVGLEE